LNVAGRESDHEETAFPCDRAQRCFCIAAADGIEDDIDALAVGKFS